jgi:hypothetical protein
MCMRFLSHIQIYTMSNLELVSITPSLALEVKTNEIKTKIIERIVELKLTDSKYKLSQDVLLLVCNLLEHLVRDKKIKKKELAVEILNGLYVLNANEKQIVENSIEFLHSNKAIKKLSRFYLFCCGVYEIFFRKQKKGSP